MEPKMPQSKFAKVNGIRIHYLEWGKPGTPDVILVHGWSGSALSWSHVVEQIQQQYHVIAHDHRGHGDSDKPETGYRLRDFVEDIHQLIAELGLKKPFYVGNSWGGCIGTIMAADYPDDISKAYLGDPVYWRMMNAFVTNLPVVLSQRKLTNEELIEEMKRQGLKQEGIDDWLASIHKYSEKALTRLLADNRDFAFSCEEYLKRIKVPTLIVVADPAAGGYILKEEADYIERIASPMVRLSRWQGVGHGVSNQQPERYVREMLSFFQE